MLITKTDVFVGLYILWGAISAVFVAELGWNSYIVAKWSVVVIVYLLCRLLPIGKKKLFLYLLIVVGAIQGIIAIAQQLGCMASNHSMFPITGFLGNPGQLGGFQAIAFITSLAMLTKGQSKASVKRYLLLALILIGYSVVIADSRAGWIASIVGLLILFGERWYEYLKTHKVIIAIIVIFAIWGVVAVYNYRSDSADGRLLVWRVCLDMIADKPVVGHGVGEFSNNYMLYQAEYFRDNPDSRFLMVADNVAYPYNEILHIWIEQGLIGVVLFVLITIAAFHYATTSIRAIMGTLVTFSMFSYPSYVYSLLILFPILLSLSSNNIWSSKKRCQWAFTIVLLISAGVIINREILFVKESQKHLSTLLVKDDPKSIEFFNNNYERIMQYRELNTYGVLVVARNHNLFDDRVLSSIIPSCENWCDIGKIYQSKNEYKIANQYYMEASDMIPTRLKPNYYLWKSYIEYNNVKLASKIATKLLTQKLKVENTFTLRAKAEIRRSMDTTKK